MTSLYQATLRGKVVETITAKNKKVKRWFYIDIQKALSEEVNREDAIIGVPEEKIVYANFGKDVILDLSTQEKEFEALMYPLSKVFDWNTWQMEFITYANNKGTFSKYWPTISRFH